MSLLEHPARRNPQNPTFANGLVYSKPMRSRYRPPRAPVTWGERALFAVITLAFGLSVLVAIALGLFLVYVSIELTLAIIRLLKEALSR